MKTIILGGGRVGYYLAKTLSERSRDIVLIERDKEVCRRVADTLDVPVIWGDGSSASVLAKAGAESCGAVIAVTGRDEVNLIACQTAKRVYGAAKTIAKANNPKNVDTMRYLGADIVISSIDTIITLLEREVDHSTIKELIPLNGGKAAVYEVVLPSDFAYSGGEISAITLPDGCNIVSITRDGELIIPRGKTRLYSGDKLLIVSAASVTNDVRRALKLKKQ